MVQLASTYEVLVVDDSPFYRRFVKQVLSSEPYSLLFANNGDEALKLFHERKPSIVVSDWVMPDLTGLELCQSIRRYRTLHLRHSDDQQKRTGGHRSGIAGRSG